MPYYIATAEAQVSDVKVPLACRFVATTDTDGHELFLIVLNKKIIYLRFSDNVTLSKWIPNLKRELAAESYHPNFIKGVAQHVALIRKEACKHHRKVRRMIMELLRQLQLHDID
jgi:hypothetical protein